MDSDISEMQEAGASDSEWESSGSTGRLAVPARSALAKRPEEKNRSARSFDLCITVFISV